MRGWHRALMLGAVVGAASTGMLIVPASASDAPPAVTAAVPATDPVQLGESRVLDDADALTADQESALDERLQQLSQTAGVESFTLVNTKRSE